MRRFTVKTRLASGDELIQTHLLWDAAKEAATSAMRHGDEVTLSEERVGGRAEAYRGRVLLLAINNYAEHVDRDVIRNSPIYVSQIVHGISAGAAYTDSRPKPHWRIK